MAVCPSVWATEPAAGFFSSANAEITPTSSASAATTPRPIEALMSFPPVFRALSGRALAPSIRGTCTTGAAYTEDRDRDSIEHTHFLPLPVCRGGDAQASRTLKPKFARVAGVASRDPE